MHTRCLATKTTTPLLSNPPSTCERPPTPAVAPHSPVAVSCSGYTHAHKTKNKNKNGSRRQVIEGGDVPVGALRCQGCNNRARSGDKYRYILSPSTRQHPLTLATAPDSPTMPCVYYTPAPKTSEEKNKQGSRRQAIVGGGVHVGALRCQGCTNRARSGKRPKQGSLNHR